MSTTDFSSNSSKVDSFQEHSSGNNGMNSSSTASNGMNQTNELLLPEGSSAVESMEPPPPSSRRGTALQLPPETTPSSSSSNLFDGTMETPKRDGNIQYHHHLEQEQVDHHHHQQQQQQRQSELVTADYQNVNMKWIGIGALIGIIIGIVFAFLISDPKTSGTLAQWIAFPGELFIFAVSCVVVPMVFTNSVLGMINFFATGKATSMGLRLGIAFIVTAFISSFVGVLLGLVFEPLFGVVVRNELENHTPQMVFQCMNGLPLILNQNTGDLHCKMNQDQETNGTLFIVQDLVNTFVRKNDYHPMNLSEQVFFLFEQIFPQNILMAFMYSDLLSVIMIGIALGIAIAKTTDTTKGSPSILIVILFQSEIVLSLLLRYLIRLLPGAIVFMVAGSILKREELPSIQEIIVFLVALIMGLLLVSIGLMGGATLIITKSNPLQYLKFIIPAQVFAAGSSSSLITLPVTIRSVVSSRKVSIPLAQFVCSLGATANKNGTAVFLSLACIYLTKAADMMTELTTAKICMIILVCALASLAAAPVPHAGLVIIGTVWYTIFGSQLPHCFILLVAIDWVCNRLVTVTNITNDTLLAFILAHQLEEAYVERHQRFLQDAQNDFGESIYEYGDGNINIIGTNPFQSSAFTSAVTL